jgi:SAM-dependent methyltransferase
MPPYDPGKYWTERLTADFNLTGVGHHGFSPAYNRWVYRRKGEMLAAALADVPAGVRALDVGSGVGWVVRKLRDHGLQVEGCDITDVAVQRLREEFAGVDFFQISLGAERVPRDDATYQAITMLDVAYHITDDALWREGIRDLARLLSPGGRLVVTDRLGAEPVQAAQHVRFRSRQDWAGVASDLGLRIDRMGPLYAWLSRSRRTAAWRFAPDALRGRVEYALERIVPIEPHLRWAVLVKDG